MSVADDKAEGFAWMLAAPGGTPEQRAKIRAEREGWYRLDPLHIADLIPNYQRPRALADKMIAEWIEQQCRRDNDRPPWEQP